MNKNGNTNGHKNRSGLNSGQAGLREVGSWIGMIVILAVGAWAATRTLPEYQRDPDTFGSQQVYEDKPVTSLVGEIRGTLAGFLYARADEYMHGGVIMRAATDQDLQNGARLASHGDEMRDTHGKGETSVIPEGERDTRGFWGMLERDTQPFMDIRHHKHKDITEALPLFRMMTWSDPHFVEAYNFGAFLIFSAAKDHNLQRALEFLDEGIQNNPNSYILHTEYGQYQLNNAKNVSLAQEHFRKAAEIVEKMTPEQIEKVDLQDRTEAERCWDYLVITYRKQGNDREELAWAKRCLKRFPDSATCHRTVKRLEGKPLKEPQPQQEKPR